MDPLHHRVDALERQIHTLHQRSRAVERRLRWWRGIACGLLVGALLTWALPSITAQEDARGGQQGLADRVAALETLLTHFTRVDNEVVITGANLRLVNGLGSTACTDDQGEPILDCPNGLGNLIVGYNEQRGDSAGGDRRNRNDAGRSANARRQPVSSGFRRLRVRGREATKRVARTARSTCASVFGSSNALDTGRKPAIRLAQAA